MCGLEIQTAGRPGHPRPRRPRRRVEQGLPVPEGRVARPPPPRPRPPARADGARRRRVARGHVGRGVRPLRGAAAADRRASTASPRSPPTSATRRSTTTRSSRYTGAVAGIPRLPVIWSAGTVDQWPKNLACAQLFGNPWSIPIPDVRPHRPVRRHGRQPARVAGLAVLVPRHPRRDRPHPRARRAHDRGRSAAHRHRRAGRRVDPDHARGWTPRSCSRSSTCSPTTASIRPRRGSSGRVRGVDEVCAAATRLRPRGRRRARAACPPSGSADSPTSSPRPSVPSCTGASACATRSSARSPRGRSTSSTC